jgi:hypothetical protein
MATKVLKYADYTIVTTFKELFSEDQILTRLNNPQLKIFKDYEHYKEKRKDYEPPRNRSTSE